MKEPTIITDAGRDGPTNASVVAKQVVDKAVAVERWTGDGNAVVGVAAIAYGDGKRAMHHPVLQSCDDLSPKTKDAAKQAAAAMGGVFTDIAQIKGVESLASQCNLPKGPAGKGQGR